MATIRETIGSYLGMASKKDVEQLQETVKTQEILLTAGDEKSKIFASGLARETKRAEDIQGLVQKRVSIKELQLLYLNNQFVFRGVNVRADELVNRGYKILEGDEIGRKQCQELIDNSGGDNLFWQLSVNTDVAGNGYLEKIPNRAKTKLALLKHVNPVNFGFETHEDNETKIVLGEDSTPRAYQQTLLENDKEKRNIVNKDIIAHLIFNSFGDEFNGVSSLQPVYNTALRLMNMEHAAAEAAVKTANPTWVVETETKSPADLNRWASVMGRISAKEVVFLPNGVKVDLKSPGNENFSDYSNYFLDAVVAALGVPKSILTGSSDKKGGNRATVQTLSKHFFSVIRSNQKYVEKLFDQIFEEYGQMAGFKPPKLVFNDVAEDADRNSQSAIELFGGGLITIEEARDLIGLETSQATKKLLEEKKRIQSGNIDPDNEQKKSDMVAHHPAEPGSPAGSQKGEKRKKKRDPNVPSVK